MTASNLMHSAQLGPALAGRYQQAIHRLRLHARVAPGLNPCDNSSVFKKWEPIRRLGTVAPDVAGPACGAWREVDR